MDCLEEEAPPTIPAFLNPIQQVAAATGGILTALFGKA